MCYVTLYDYPGAFLVLSFVFFSQTKCERYWPEKKKADYGKFIVKLVNKEIYAHYTISLLKVNHQVTDYKTI